MNQDRLQYAKEKDWGGPHYCKWWAEDPVKQFQKSPNQGDMATAVFVLCLRHKGALESGTQTICSHAGKYILSGTLQRRATLPIRHTRQGDDTHVQ